MIGNDIIDIELSNSESKWNRNGFLEKIFTEQEQALIFESKNKNLMVWKLWSIKESAYKIWNRKTGIQSFNPKFFECFLGNNEIDCVIFDKKSYCAKTSITEKYIHSIVVEKLSDFKNVTVLENRLKIIKVGNLPFYVQSNGYSNPNVSLSNHGKFEKIVFLNS